MIRFAFAAAALALAACQPALEIDPKDPYASLHPWDPEWREVEGEPGGLQWVVIERGDGAGASPRPEDFVEVHYDGRLAATGEPFDSSYEGGEPVTFRLNQVIPGWTEGLQKMKPGDHFMFWIPADLAYGSEERGPIPANSDLMFRVELLGVEAPPEADADAWAKATPWPSTSADVIRSASGLEYFVVESGDPAGGSPDDNDLARVHYEGRLDDGTVFDSSYERGQPELFPVGMLIPGWVEALKLMKPGDHWMVRLRPNLAYGSESAGRIPPNSPLTFEVELVEFQPVPNDPAPAVPAPQ
jgi:peptidylprolyl isomerase